jgi:6-phosphofructokinase 1
MKRIGVFTSGGDAPGMNAAIRSVVRVATTDGLDVLGIYRGYQGMIEGEISPLGPRSVSNIIQRGGTVLKTSRSKEFESLAGREKAAANLKKFEFEGLIAIGGNGTMRGALDLQEIWPGKIIALPGTIDNDLAGTDLTIGYDTAVTTALYGIDRIRDTAESHERVFLIEVMGRHAGFIALDVAVAGGAEEVLVPEFPDEFCDLAVRLKSGIARGKRSSIVVVAEGDEGGGAQKTAERLLKEAGIDSRVVVLGHLQRGGSPTAVDRILATELGAFAVKQIQLGKTGVMAGRMKNDLVLTPMREAVYEKKQLNSFLMKMMRALAS